jgi:hypothetical protein
MKNSGFLLLIALFFHSATYMVSQTLDFEKSLGFDEFYHLTIDSAAKQFTFYQLAKAGDNQVNIKSYVFDKQFNRISENSETLSFDEGKRKYPWWKFTSETYSITNFYVNSEKSKVRFEILKTSYTYDWKKYYYNSSSKIEKEVIPVNKLKQNYTEEIFTVRDTLNNIIYTVLDTKKHGADIFKLNSDLSYESTSLFATFSKPYAGKIVRSNYNGSFFMAVNRKKDLIPKGESVQYPEGNVLVLVDKDLSLKKEVEIKDDTVFAVLQVEKNIILTTNKNIYIYDHQLNLLEFKINQLAIYGTEFYNHKNRMVFINTVDKKQELFLLDGTFRLIDSCSIHEDFLKVVTGFYINGQDYLLVITAKRYALRHEARYNLVKINENAIKVVSSINNDQLFIPEKDKSRSKLFASDQYFIEKISITDKRMAKNGDGILNMYFTVNNTKMILNNFARFLIIDKNEKLFCFEVFAMNSFRPISQIVFECNNDYYWIALGNSSTLPVSDPRLPKIARIDGKTKEMKKFMYVEKYDLDTDLPFLPSFEENSVILLTEKAEVVKVIFN